MQLLFDENVFIENDDECEHEMDIFWDIPLHHVPSTLFFATYHDFSEHMAHLCAQSRKDMFPVTASPECKHQDA